MENTTDKKAFKINGFAALLAILAALALEGWLFYELATSNEQSVALILLVAFFAAVTSVCFNGFITIDPNNSKVLLFFGSYTGTVKESGFWWVNPLTIKKKVTLRIRNFNSERLKVNDALGNPIEIAAVIVWKVVDSASATFNVDDYEEFVEIQSETAIRALSSHYSYDSLDENDASGITLRGNPEEIAVTLKKELENRVSDAGIDVIEARLSHLAYAQEIAQSMLRRQQAQAIISARQKIVEGAVGMVEYALQHLSEKKVVDLDDERKAAMVNNLMVALVSETEAQPVINAGTLY